MRFTNEMRKKRQVDTIQFVKRYTKWRSIWRWCNRP